MRADRLAALDLVGVAQARRRNPHCGRLGRRCRELNGRFQRPRSPLRDGVEFSGPPLERPSLRRTQDAGGGVNVQDIPFRLIPCMVAGLAFYLSQKIPEALPRMPMLKQEYEEQWALASTEDRDKAPDRYVPRNMFYA